MRDNFSFSLSLSKALFGLQTEKYITQIIMETFKKNVYRTTTLNLSRSGSIVNRQIKTTRGRFGNFSIWLFFADYSMYLKSVFLDAENAFENPKFFFRRLIVS